MDFNGLHNLFIRTFSTLSLLMYTVDCRNKGIDQALSRVPWESIGVVAWKWDIFLTPSFSSTLSSLFCKHASSGGLETFKMLGFDGIYVRSELCLVPPSLPPSFTHDDRVEYLVKKLRDHGRDW